MSEVEGEILTPEGKLVHIIFPDDDKICWWHLTTRSIVRPDGNLKHCKYHCQGYNHHCDEYIPNSEINSRRKNK